MPLLPPSLDQAARETLAACERTGALIATAESCTGGLIAAAITAITGSSTWFERGFVTYSNRAKTELLGVPAALIERVGAVSEDVARAMATGALSNSKAACSVAVTGIAGPGGGSAEKPVGLVHLAAASGGRVIHRRHVFPGDRDAVRLASAIEALGMLVEVIGG